MMKIINPSGSDLPLLADLWKEAFADSEDFINGFFETAFSPEHTLCIKDEGRVVSALYILDCSFEGEPIAYIYAVATAEQYRGRGLARRLMESAYEILKEKGYAGAILVPGSKELFAMYGKLGYRTAGTVREFVAKQGDTPVALTQIDAAEYARLRKTYLPRGGVVQEGALLAFLGSYARFYKGDDFLLSATGDGGQLIAQELLGNADAAPGILQALNLPKGCFRTPGTHREFAMYLPLTADCPTPGYFGLALD